MHISILEAEAPVFFKKALEIESEAPSGRWRYFKFIDNQKVYGIYEAEESTSLSLEPHQDFFKHFLGTFKPSLNQTFSIVQASSFTGFCKRLNTILKDQKPVYDLSVSKKWIWTEGDEIQIPQKLQDFLD